MLITASDIFAVLDPDRYERRYSSEKPGDGYPGAHTDSIVRKQKTHRNHHGTSEPGGLGNMAVYCPNCGKQLPDYAEFCDNCGKKIPVNKAQERPVLSKETEKKKSSGLLAFLKWFVILNVVGGIGIALIGILESVFHRTPPAELPSQQTADTNTGTGKPDPVKTAETQTQSGGTPVPVQTETQTSVPEDIPQGLSDITNVWFDDFLFYENDVYDNGIPENAVLREAGYTSGEWKYCITFNRTLAGEERIDEIGTAELAFSEHGAQLILHPQYIRFGSDVSSEDEAEAGYEPFAGSWNPEYIDLSDGNISIGLGHYYSFEGRDYVLGNIVVGETGMFGDVLLVRP